MEIEMKYTAVKIVFIYHSLYYGTSLYYKLSELFV